MMLFNFCKTIKRNDFTKVFGGAGKRRTLKHFKSNRVREVKRFKVQKTRRANLGKNNKRFNKIHKFKMFVTWGKCIKKLKPISRFRR